MANALQTSLVLTSKSPLSAAASDRTRPTVEVCANCNLRRVALVTRTQKRNKRGSTSCRLLLRHGSHSLHHDSICGPLRPPIRAQTVEFKARREVSIPFREGAFPAVEYLKELERVVKVTFPDSARIAYMGNSIWRSRLKPITFFTLSATPVCDIKVYNKGNTLQIHSDQLQLDFSGFPEDYINQTVRFNLQGQLEVDAKKGSEHKAGRQVDFRGQVSLSLRSSLPLPFSLLPETVSTTVGDTILDTILGAMESALVRGIIADYQSWCWTKQSTKSDVALRVTGSTS